MYHIEASTTAGPRMVTAALEVLEVYAMRSTTLTVRG